MFYPRLLRYLLPGEVYKHFHVLDQKHHFKLFRIVGVLEKHRNISKNTCEWVHILVKIQAQDLTMNSFARIFQEFFEIFKYVFTLISKIRNIYFKETSQFTAPVGFYLRQSL